MEKNTKPDTITINSYQKVWGYEKMLYQIADNLSLPTPIVEADAWYFMGCLGIVALVIAIFKIPIPSAYIGLFVYLGIPLGATAILRYKSFDGKNPIVFLADYLHFLISRSKETEYFIPVVKSPVHEVTWRVGYRHRLRCRVPGPERSGNR